MQSYLFFFHVLNFSIDNVSFLPEIELKGPLAVTYSIRVLNYVHTMEMIKLNILVIKIYFLTTLWQAPTKRVFRIFGYIFSLRPGEVWKKNRMKFFLNNKYLKVRVFFSKYIY